MKRAWFLFWVTLWTHTTVPYHTALAQSKAPCLAVPISLASEILGAGTRITQNEATVCEYTAASSGGNSRLLRLQVTSPGNSETAKQLFLQTQQQLGGKPEQGFGERAFSTIDKDVGCSGMTALREARFYEVSLCGPGFGTAADQARLREALQRLLAGS